MTAHAHTIDELVRTARRAREAGLVVATSGNVSARLDDRSFAISCSGCDLGELAPDRVARCAIDGTAPAGGPDPSLEAPFHRAIYRERPDVGGVLHFQSPFATAWACTTDGVPDLAFIPEVPAYLGSVETVPWHLPGSEDLADAVGRRVRDAGCRALLLRNHGQIALGPTPATALRNAEVLEFACRVAAVGVDLQCFDAKTRQALREYGS